MEEKILDKNILADLQKAYILLDNYEEKLDNYEEKLDKIRETITLRNQEMTKLLYIELLNILEE